MKLRAIFFNTQSIRHKLMMIFLATTGLVVLLFLMTSGLLIREFFNAKQAMQRDLSAQAHLIAGNSSAAVVFNDRPGATEILSTLSSSPIIIEAAIFLPDKELFAGFQRQAPQGEPNHPPDKLVAHSAIDTEDLAVSSDIIVEGKQVGTLRIGATLRPIYDRLLVFSLTIITLTAAGLGVSFFLLRRLRNSITGPLLDLTDMMERVAATEDYSLRAGTESQDEVGLLTSRFNEMLEKIQLHDHALEKELQERQRTEERLNYIAHYDSVTTLPNRHFFNACLDQLSSQAREQGTHASVATSILPLVRPTEPCAALMFIDLDNFKIINDNLGHRVGDMVLKAVATRLRFTLRPTDVIARIGGDEFAILLSDLVAPGHAGIVAEKISHSLTDAFQIGEHELYVHASIGIAIFPQDATNPMDLLRLADTAMYHAKERGKNTYQFFLPEMHGKAQKRMDMESGLRHALANGEMEVYYQPKYDLIQKKIIGAEALLRWKRPGIGMVGPYDFIPVAEETGLIVPIGEWVLHQACQQISRWNVQFKTPIHIAVNLSGRQFKELNLVDIVRNALQQAGIPAQQLELEITESIVVGTEGTTIDKLNELRAMNLNISIDDFGTGYSSMSYLKRLPISTLKIDRSFIKDTPGDSDDVAIASAIIAMAKVLKLDIVAEGVETQEQIDFLLSQGCNIIQGYFISPPVPAQAFGEMLRAQATL